MLCLQPSCRASVSYLTAAAMQNLPFTASYIPLLLKASTHHLQHNTLAAADLQELMNAAVGRRDFCTCNTERQQQLVLTAGSGKHNQLHIC